MENISKKTGSGLRNASLLFFALCGLCCALPLAGIAGGAGIAAVLGGYKDAMIVLMILVSMVLIVRLKMRKSNSACQCTIDCNCGTKTKLNTNQG